MFDVGLSDYREFFLVAVGDTSVSVTTIEPDSTTFREPQTFVFAKPYGWAEGLDDQDALMQLWQAVGTQR